MEVAYIPLGVACITLGVACITVAMQQHVARMNGEAHDVSTPSAIVNNHSPASSLVKTTSADDMTVTLSKSPPGSQRKGQSFGTLPRDAQTLQSLPPPSPRKHFTLTQSLNRHKVASNYRYDVSPDPFLAPTYDAGPVMSLNKGIQHSNTMPRSYGYAGHAPAHSATLSREASATGLVQPSSGSETSDHMTQQPMRKQRGFMSSFGKGFFKMRSGKWSSSAPNLGDTMSQLLSLRFSFIVRIPDLLNKHWPIY